MKRSAPLTLAAMSLGYGVVQLDVTIVNVAINSIGQSFGGSVAALQWVVSAYTIAFAAFILTAGVLGDRIGAKRVLVSGFTLFTAASLACGLAPNLGTLIAARLVQGVGASVLVPNSLALLNHAYPDDAGRHHAVSIWAAGASLTLTAGPLIGGLLIARGSWRDIFFVNVPIGLIGIWLTIRYTEETPPSPSREVDRAGQLIAILALGCLAGSLIGGGAFGWTNATVVIGLGAAIALLVALVRVEGASAHPMLPLALFKNAPFTATSLGGLLVNVAFYGLIFVFSLFFQRIGKHSALWTGLAFAPMTLAVFVTNLSAPGVVRRLGARLTIALGGAIAAVGCAALLGIHNDSSYAALCAQLIAMGAGLGLLVPPLTSTLLGSVDKAQSGIASGVLNAMRQTGSVIGVALLGAFPIKLALTVGCFSLIASCAAALTGIPADRRHAWPSQASARSSRAPE
jgi:MFS transporter, DHA2 family, methylenomycin A resistance protein